MVRATFIVVNFNGESFIRKCLDSIFEQDYIGFEVIVVDNGSHDGSVQLIQNEYPSVKLILLNENTGFTGGNNAGLHIAKGEYIALINNDVVLERKWLANMMKGILAANDIGLCASKIIISGTDLIDSIGDKFTTAFTGTKVGEYQSEVNFTKSLDMGGVCAAAALYKRTMIDRIGFLDDIFFLNHEDTDLNIRAWLAGYRCRFVPDAIAYHDVNRTIGTLSDTSVYYFSRNNVWVWLINVPLYFMVRNCHQRIFYEICAAFYYCIIHKKYKAYISGKIDALLSLNEVLKKRRQIQKLVCITNAKIKSDLTPILSYILAKLKQ